MYAGHSLNILSEIPESEESHKDANVHARYTSIIARYP